MFERTPLRQHVQKEILARIADCRLSGGTRINESHLSADLGISRTPLREAMLGLEAVGFLESDMGRGFLVPLICREDFSQGQAILGKMAPYALSLALPLAAGQIMELNNLLGRSRLQVSETGKNRSKALADLIFRWSTLCTHGCPNKMLVADVTRLKALAKRYWYEASKCGFDPTAMVASYTQLYEMLRAKQPQAATEHWEEHISRYATEAARHLPKKSQLSKL